MSCDEIEAADMAEKYVLGQLNADDQEAYEAHYFGCSRCFDELQLCLAMQTELKAMAGARPAHKRRSVSTAWTLWAVAAAIFVAIGSLGVWRLTQSPAARTPQAAAVRTPPPGGASLELLARVDPPPYSPPVLRGGTTVDPRFRDAMEKYRRGEFAAAIPGLLSAAEADPKSADARFFLGICYLMDNQIDKAIEQLRATVELGPTLDLEMAHFYLAKALLRQNEIVRAEGELERAIALHGDLETQSQDLLARLRSLPASR